MKNSIAMIALCLLAVGCEDGDEKVFKGSGSNESKPGATLLPEGAGITGLGATSAAPTEAARVTFDLAVYGNSGAKLCDGEVKIQIMSDFTMKFPDSTAQCVSMKVDLSKALGGAETQGGKQESNITSTDGILNFKSIAGGTFDPPRPFLLGPVVQNSEKYKGFTHHSEHQVTSASGSGSGAFDIEVLDVDTTYKNKYLEKPFDKILHWKIKASGFDGVKKSEGLLFKEMEWVWNTNPIMIPKLTIRGELGDLIEAEGGGSDLVGEIKIDLSVKEYDFDGE